MERIQDLTRDQILALIRDEQVDEVILDEVGRAHLQDEEICRAILGHPGASVHTLSFIAQNAGTSLSDSLAADRDLLARFQEIRQALLANPNLSSEAKALLQQEVGSTGPGPVAERAGKEEEKKKDLYRLIRELSTGQRLSLAKKGNKDARMILVRDPNEMIALEVIASARITDSEIVYISQMKDISDKVLRAIANNRKYRSHKQIVLNLLHNPKTPPSVSLGLGFNRLTDKELSGLMKDHNIPGVICRAAAIVLEKRKKQSTPAGRGH